MADTYKILGQTTAASIEELSQENQAKAVYTVPSGKQASISSISLINTSSTSEQYSLGVIKANDVSTSTGSVTYDVGVSAYVATGSYASSAISLDGITWTPSDGGLPGALSYYPSVAYGNGKFVAVGWYTNRAAYSTDGVTWTYTNLPTTGNWSTIAYGNGRFVTLSADTTTAVYSTDGINWTQANLGTYDFWTALAYGGDKFVAMAYSSNKVIHSTDGITWELSYLPTVREWTSIAYGNGMFVAVAGNTTRSVYSTDGINWTISTLPNSSNWNSIAYGNGLFLAISGSAIFTTSVDGFNWDNGNNLPAYFWESITFGDGKFVAIATGPGDISYSTVDGLTWTMGSLPIPSPLSIAYGSSTQQLQSTKLVLPEAKTIIPTRSIDSNAVDEIVGGIALSAGDQIRVYSDSPDLIVQAYGVEL